MGFPLSGTPLGDHDWLGHRWSAWMPLMAAHPLALAQLPSAPGVYRVRRAGVASEVLWIGWARGGVRAAVERLSRQVHLPLEPYNDPASPALVLWERRTRCGESFEVSGAALEPDSAEADRLTREFTRYATNTVSQRGDE